MAEPHWSDMVIWRDGRWDPMSNAPRDREVRARMAGRKPLAPVRFERGCWRKRGRSVAVEEWQPLHAKVDEASEFVWPFPIHSPQHRAWLEEQFRNALNHKVSK